MQKLPSLETVQQSHRHGKPFTTPLKDAQHAMEKASGKKANMSSNGAKGHGRRNSSLEWKQQ